MKTTISLHQPVQSLRRKPKHHSGHRLLREWLAAGSHRVQITLHHEPDGGWYRSAPPLRESQKRD